ncbi:MAG: carbamoyl-phosphate synthase large subunit [Acidobacteria bacterium]|nr:carbamoyl-phosphate synthase large subunit [Acidobacteriota bacterium]
MPRDKSIRRVLIIGSGPIVIGQACEFDYSGTQACKALRAEGVEVILVNSNPATIMTDPDVADRTYIEPLNLESLIEIIGGERPDALLPTVGGQTALNLAAELAASGELDRLGVRLIGASLRAIQLAEDRILFKKAMTEAGIDVPRSARAASFRDAQDSARSIGYPVVIRPSFTLGGSGGGIAYNAEELAEISLRGLDLSPIGEVLIEESVIGWKEFELEVMRDRAGNGVVICTIENFDAMGVHTGDSITVAPIQTLTDREYQKMRDWALRVMTAVGVETGGSNVQFAVDPRTGRMLAIEMNPRVSRSSALASKATGFPIAKIAALLALGYTLDEIPNDITKKTPSSFEPVLDYVVVKIPRWAFEKFPTEKPLLTTQMKSVGEAMAIGRTFKEALLKCIRSLETGRHGLDGYTPPPDDRLVESLATPHHERLFHIHWAIKRGMPLDRIARLTGVDPWFLEQLAEIVEMERRVAPESLKEMKRAGFSDQTLAGLLNTTDVAIRERRRHAAIRPVYKRVDTCAGEFEATTPYLYSTYEEECEAAVTSRPKAVILGSGPNRIGQGIEFDYCCCQAAFALREEGIESIMVNCNPETVSTDYDTSDRLYFEPLTFEDVMNIVELERPRGVIAQFGGQTPLKLSRRLHEAGVPILGTGFDAIDLAEDRERFARLLADLDIRQPRGGLARTVSEAFDVASDIGFPLLLRPSYVLGGRAMVLIHDREQLERSVEDAFRSSGGHPLLIDSYLEDATEADLDAIYDGEDLLVGGIMEHIEEAGIHSGDSTALLPPHNLPAQAQNEMILITRRVAEAMSVRGLVNVQFAIRDGEVFVIEVNPRASRTVPFIAKATGVPLVGIATKVSLGRRIHDVHKGPMWLPVGGFFAKVPVFPFTKFPGIDPVLGPEMKSTGEVMGIGETEALALARAYVAAGMPLPREGSVFLSLSDRDKPALGEIARELAGLGFRILATEGTSRLLGDLGLAVERINKVSEGRPHVIDFIKNRGVDLILNTLHGRESHIDEENIRRAATQHAVPCVSNLNGIRAVLRAIREIPRLYGPRRPIQEVGAVDAGGVEGILRRPPVVGSSG